MKQRAPAPFAALHIKDITQFKAILCEGQTNPPEIIMISGRYPNTFFRMSVTRAAGFDRICASSCAT